ncbi:MAG: hypothetical protein HC802_07930 [Caldilineaceae bacterium]|nr:hypothetical protein [Caldilineaceae bacterium]
MSRDDVALGSSATLNAQIWLGLFPWRPTAGWAAIASMLAAGFLNRPLDWSWQTLALLLLLVDLFWGSVWRLAAGRSELLPLGDRVARHEVWLPYMKPNSPAAQLLGADAASSLPLLFRVALPTVAVTVGVSLTLGASAFWMTGAVVVASLLGWISLRALQTPPALLHSMVTIALPWSLGLIHWGIAPGHPDWSAQLVLLSLWTIHNWGEGRTMRFGRDWLGIGLLAVADIGIGLLLIVAQAPLWLALISILWIPTWISVYLGRPLQRMNFWWLLAMLISGAALGQIL